jgi:hypothetical protein
MSVHELIMKQFENLSQEHGSKAVLQCAINFIEGYKKILEPAMAPQLPSPGAPSASSPKPVVKDSPASQGGKHLETNRKIRRLQRMLKDLPEEAHASVKAEISKLRDSKKAQKAPASQTADNSAQNP